MNKLSLLLSFVLLSAAIPVRAATTFDSAVEDYNNHNYNSALEKLAKLERSNPNNEKIHYYMALSYQGASQMESAKQEYTWVADKATNEQLKNNAMNQLQSIDRWSRTRRYSGNGNYFVKSRGPAFYRPRIQSMPASSGST